MDPLSAISEELVEIGGQIADIFLALSQVNVYVLDCVEFAEVLMVRLSWRFNGGGVWIINEFQKLEKIKDSNRQSRQLEELTDKMRDCKRLIKEFDKEIKNTERRIDPDTRRMLSEKRQRK